MGKIYKALDAADAVRMATDFQNNKDYDLFRGQTRDWIPHSTLVRKFLDPDPDAYKNAVERIDRFAAWVDHTPGLEELRTNDDALLAIAQHHGIPTALLDFSRDPGVAGFFATHSDNPVPAGTTSCIYCLNWADLQDMWATFGKIKEMPDLRLVEITVSGLWRLEAQNGVFISCNSNWDTWYDLDKISFPYATQLPFPTVADIYPVQKSGLEILLDQYFAAEKGEQGSRELLKLFDELAKSNPNFHHASLDSPADRLHGREYTTFGSIPDDPSWDEAKDPMWTRTSDGRFFDVRDGQVLLQTDLKAAPAQTRSDLTYSILHALRRDRTLRDKTVKVVLSSAAQFDERLQKALTWLWSGLRGLPYSNEELATAMGNCAWLYRVWDTVNGNEASAFMQCFGRSIEVEFGAPDGSFSRGWVNGEYLKSALRDDISSYLTTDGKRALENIEGLLQICSNPRSLFNYRRLAALFATQISPAQVLFRPEREAFFSPARLDGLGLP